MTPAVLNASVTGAIILCLVAYGFVMGFRYGRDRERARCSAIAQKHAQRGEETKMPTVAGVARLIVTEIRGVENKLTDLPRYQPRVVLGQREVERMKRQTEEN
jgi:hypothetical protein